MVSLPISVNRPISDEQKDYIRQKNFINHKSVVRTTRISIHSTEYVFLGFHRLSINGLENGNQPMQHPDHSDIYLWSVMVKFIIIKNLAAQYNMHLGYNGQ